MDSTATIKYFLPELNFWFGQYCNNNLEIPIKNYIKVPNIIEDYSIIQENSIFELLFNNNFGSNISNFDTTSYDVTTADSTSIVITDYT